jgi:hypothetical protein
MSRLENQVTNREIKGMRSFFVDQFLKSYSQQPEEILLDIDGWDALTHGHQQLSLFHGYYRTGEKARLFDDVYYAAGTWKEPRRVVMKAEWLEKGANPRFVVTNLLTDAQELYDNFYVQRGASSEHRIKELKLGIKADRLSCQKFIVNQFRLFLSQAA